MDYHTFLFKLPFFYIEQKIGLSIISHTILSLMFTVPMFGCFGYISQNYQTVPPYRTLTCRSNDAIFAHSATLHPK